MESRNVIASVGGCYGGITLFDVRTKQIRRDPNIYTYGSPKFFDQFQSIISLNKIKAITFGFIGNEFSTSLAEHHFRLACCEFCEKHGIFCYFPSSQYSDIAAALTQAPTMVKEGERVLLLIAFVPGRSPLAITLKRGKENYQFMNMRGTAPLPFSQSWKADILASSNPTKTILMTLDGYTSPNDIKEMKRLFKRLSG